MKVSRRNFAALSAAAAGTALASPTGAIASALTDTADTSSVSSGARDGILVPEHFVPTPKTISPAAQTMLRTKLPVGGLTPPASLKDLAGWKAYREAGQVGMVAMTKDYATKYPAIVITHRLSAFDVYEVTPKNLSAANRDRAILYIHGGGWTGGGGEAAVYPAQQMAGMAAMKVYSVDYRLIPEVAFPAPLDDTLEAYRFVLQRHRPGSVGVFGPSAGANLAAALVLKARDTGVPLPAACAMHSCPSDVQDYGDSGNTNYMVDIILRQAMPELLSNYAGTHDPKDPYLSPVFGDYSKGFCPVILTSGTRDLLLSGTVRLHRAMVRGGAKAELHVWEAMTHAPFFNAPEEDELYAQLIGFMTSKMTLK